MSRDDSSLHGLVFGGVRFDGIDKQIGAIGDLEIRKGELDLVAVLSEVGVAGDAVGAVALLKRSLPQQ